MTADLPKTSGPREAFRLGDLEVLPASNEVRGPGGTVRLRPLLMEILLRLAREPGAVVRRETLLEEAWPRRMVNDEVLSRAIAELRAALGDDARESRYVETLPKVGYRLVAPVEPLPPPPPADTSPIQHTAAPASAPPTSPRLDLPAARPARRPRLAVAFLGMLAVLAAVGSAITWHRDSAPGTGGLEAQLAAARPFTADPGLELAPRFSPDGRRVAFVSGDANSARLVVQDLEGTQRVTIEAPPGQGVMSPVFFPDGARIAFWRGAARGACEIVEMRLADRAERRLLDCALAPRPRFDLSPDGTQIAFSGRARAQYPLGLWVAPVGGAPRALTSPEPGGGDDVLPRFSPDGREIAFFRGTESHRRAWVIAAAGGEPQALSKLEGLAYGFAWLGKRGPLLVASDWLGFRALTVLDRASGQATLAGARGARFPDVAPNGDIAFENAVYSANLWQLAPGMPGEPPRALWTSTRYTSQPVFSPDGRRLAFASNREGFDALYVGTPGEAPRRIAGSESERFLRPHWSADGRAVLAVRITSATRPARQEAVRVRADGGGIEVIGAIGANVADVRESPDGRWLVWGEVAGHAMRLHRAPRERPAGGERLALPLVSHFQLNSREIVFAQPQLDRLTRCRLADLACAPMELAVPEPDLFHWSLTERSIYRRVVENGSPRLERRSLDDLRVTGTWAVAPGGAGSSIAASPDDTGLVVAREEGPAVDLMIARR